MTPDEELELLSNLAQIAGKRAERGTVVCRAPAPVVPTTETWRVIVDTPEGPHVFETREVLVTKVEPGYYTARCEGWHGYVAAATPRAAVAKVAAHGDGWPVVEILNPMQLSSVEEAIDHTEREMAHEAEIAWLEKLLAFVVDQSESAARMHEREVGLVRKVIADAVRDVVGDIERREAACRKLVDHTDNDQDARCSAKADAYKHAAELVAAALKDAAGT